MEATDTAKSGIFSALPSSRFRIYAKPLSAAQSNRLTSKLTKCRFSIQCYPTLNLFNPNASKIVAVGSQKYSMNQYFPQPDSPPASFRTTSPFPTEASSADSITSSTNPRVSSSASSPATSGTSPSTSAPAHPTSANGPDSTSRAPPPPTRSNSSGSPRASLTVSSSSLTPPRSSTKPPTSITPP